MPRRLAAKQFRQNNFSFISDFKFNTSKHTRAPGITKNIYTEPKTNLNIFPFLRRRFNGGNKKRIKIVSSIIKKVFRNLDELTKVSKTNEIFFFLK